MRKHDAEARELREEQYREQLTVLRQQWREQRCPCAEKAKRQALDEFKHMDLFEHHEE